jgi:hypothetical protein
MHRSYSQTGGQNIPLSALGAERVGVRWGEPRFEQPSYPPDMDPFLSPRKGGEGLFGADFCR